MLAEWWCLLNKWRWPHVGLGKPDPVPEKYDSNSRRGQIMNAICARIGIHECLREWNRDYVPGANRAAAFGSGFAPSAETANAGSAGLWQESA